MNHASLFTGIGGFDLAAEWMGWNNVFQVEIDPFCTKVLEKNFPNAKRYGDIKQFDGKPYRGTVDVLTGGFPCQPYSVAGKRKGKEDDRHLWPQMLRAIREIQPTYVVGENVRGLTNWNGGMVFDEVQADLEAEGYEVTPFLLPACAVNAPHRRDRIWFVAYSHSHSRRSTESNINEEGQHLQRRTSRLSVQRATANTYVQRNTPSGKSEETERNRSQRIESEGKHRSRSQRAFGLSGLEGYASDTGLLRQEIEYVSTGWDRFPTQSPVCNGDDGLSSQLDSITFPKWRSESIKAGGNAIVPQVAYEIFKALEQTMIQEK